MQSPCPSCGFANEPDERFCGGCGQTLADRPRESLHAYTPKHLAERILTSRAAMEGERKQVSVLFCDLVDSSRLVATLEPETLHEIMDRALRLMAEAVHRYEGTVNQFLGDGLMALFGAPIALEDHALRAVHAALAIQETVTAYGRELVRERGVDLRLRIGINTGPVVVGRIGDDLRMDYTAIGDTTHLAARLQTLAEPGGVLVSEPVYRAVEGYVRADALGPVTIKGRAGPVRVFNVTGRRGRRSRLEVRIERGLSPLAGRQEELGVLAACWERVKSGRGQVVGLVGEAGVGKSRLLFEFRQSIKDEPVAWIEGQCSAYGQGTPYLPLLEILRASFQIEDGDPPLQIEEKLRRGVEPLEHGVDELLPFLRELFQLPGENDVVRHLDPQTKRRRTFETIRALAVAAARNRPVVLALEDLHWADRTTEDYLGFFLRSIADAPILVITTQRPDYTVRWKDEPWYASLGLEVLGDREVETLMKNVLGASEVPGELLRSVVEKAEGNPLAIEEIAASLLERGIVVRQQDGVRWVGDLTVDFPATIQDIVRARIDRLAEEVKTTLQNAAAIGRRFGATLLAAISDPIVEVSLHLATLKQLELVYETRSFPETELAFKHAVIQDVAYQSLLAKRRADLHGAIGQVIEEVYADQLDEQLDLLVHHYRLGRQHEKVAEYGIQAGDRAARLHATAEARAHYEAALDAVRALPVTPETERAEIDAVLKLAAVGTTRQDIQRDRENLGRARGLAEALGDDARLARVLYWLGRLEYVLWNPRAAVDYACQSLEVGERLHDDAIIAPPVNLLGRIYWIQSDYTRSAQMLERSVEQMRRLGNKGEESTAAATAGCVFGLMGRFERAYPFADRGILVAEEIKNPFSVAAAYQQRGIIRDQQGDWLQALADYQVARAVAERVGDVFRVFVLKSYEGRARAMVGDLAAGRLLVEESLELAARIGTRLILGWQKTFLAGCVLAAGDHAAAAIIAEEAVQAASETGDRMPLALAKRALADALACAEGDSRGRADALMREAIEILGEIGAQPELARTYVRLAVLLRQAGEDEAARSHLTTSLAMFEAMGMSWDEARVRELLGA
jgi:class 3 adenylate cyclase/tetratricopeptide (TPR) repeat protein/ABC-type dipeptide/oligopeptide/nickel transport system ATPase component